ncbi:MAG: sensor domain-containing protein [Dehalococcoidia bacterium]
MPTNRWTLMPINTDIFDQAAIAMALVSPDGRWLHVNEALCSLLGYHRSELVGASLYAVTHPADQKLTEAALTRMAAQPRLSDALEKRYLRKDGAVVWVLVTSVLLRGPDSRSRCLFTQMEDITARKQAEAALQASEDRKDAILASALDAIVSMDHTGRIVEFNPAAEQLFGYAATQALGETVADLLVPGPLRVQHGAGLARYLTTNEATILGRRVELVAQHAAGATFPIELTVTRVAGRTPPLFTAFIRDLSARNRAEQEAHEREVRFRMLFADNPLPMAVYDIDTLAFLEVNDAATAVYGYSRPEWLAMRVPDLQPPANNPGARLAGAQLQSSGLRLARRKLRHRDGRLIDAELSEHPMTFAERRTVLAVAQDITERVQLEEQLERQAFTDTLTGLPNRALFMDRLIHAGERSGGSARPVAVLCLNLDRFKVVNDTLGRAAADTVLIASATRLRGCIRTGDTVARVGGDEFTVLLEEVTCPADALQVAAAAVLAFQQPFLIAEQECYVTVSVGVAFGHPTKLSDQELLRRADVALLEAKARGRSCAALYDVAMDGNSEAWLGLETDLRRAVEREELVLHYQPDVDLVTGRVTGVEALVRWSHPRRGLIPPAQFIPLAEETGLIRSIGGWVLREACRQAALWRQAHPQLQALVMSVNLSARQLDAPGFVDAVAAVLAETALPAHALRLELTESTVMRRVEEMIPLLHALKALGVKLAIDDFGTGYSSLSYLARFPVDTLKVDRSFVQQLGTDAATTAIVRATVALAHALHMDVTAEGIEQSEQLVRLRRLHCDRGQGFYFSRPLPAAAIASLLTESLPVAPSRSA